MGAGYDGAGRVWVACEHGTLVGIDIDVLEPSVTHRLPPDLRDVVVDASGVWVSRLRSAQVLHVDPEGGTFETFDLKSVPERPGARAAEPAVAWRMRPYSGGPGVVITHQVMRRLPDFPPRLPATPVYYGGNRGPDCRDAAVGNAWTRVRPLTPGFRGVDVDEPRELRGGLPLDIAAGRVANGSPSGCGPYETRTVAAAPVNSAPPYENVNVLWLHRDPWELSFADAPGHPDALRLADSDMVDTGHILFHDTGRSALACASCHPEGADDGVVWELTGEPRRTLDLRGGISNTAPFHWDGTLETLYALMDDVFTTRMQGPPLDDAHVQALADWMDSLAAPPRHFPPNVASAARGRVLFEREDVGCASCHEDSRYGGPRSVDVGTGGTFQVPPLLGLGTRTPLMHDGCAQSLTDRFAPDCGGGDRHGVTSHLTPDELTDLIQYLRTL